jgi:hypothetical protein
MTNDKDSAVTQADIDLADAVALAITSVSVAYSHDTNDEMRTVNKRWFAHDSCEGNPFDKEEWLEIFTDKKAAHEYVANLRQQRASQVVARHRQSQTDALLIANERKAIAAWLRGEVDTDYTDPEYDIGRNLADAVERGAYIQDQSK